ncbi:MAG: hypothetical protein AAB472_03975, partial [Patescibacteria group bacterium]
MLNLWAHVYSSGNSNYAVVDSDSFVVGGQSGSSYRYPPKLYSVSPSGISLDASAWKLAVGRKNNDGTFEEPKSNPPSVYDIYGSPRMNGYAVVGGKLVGNIEGPNYEPVVFSLPGLSLLDEKITTNSIIVSVGNYVLTLKPVSRGHATLDLYRLGSDNKLELVDSFPITWLPVVNSRGGMVDPLNQNRFALRELEGEHRGDIHIFNVASGKLVEEEVRKRPSKQPNEPTSKQYDRGIYALYGKYLITSLCTTDKNSQNGSCELVLDDGTTTLFTAVPQDDPGSVVSGLAVSKSGIVMAVVNINAYLYKIVGATTPPSGGSRVTLVGEIYNHKDIPYEGAIGAAFIWPRILWLSGGYFAVNEQCSNRLLRFPGSTITDADRTSPRGEGNNIHLQGGLYVFKGDGTFVDRRNVCWDGDIPGVGVPQGKNPPVCAEGQGCTVGINAAVTGPTTFVRQLTSTAFQRPTVSYGVTASGVSLRGKTNDGDLLGGPRVKNVVVVGNTVIATRQVTGDEDLGYKKTSIKNAFFSLPGLKLTNEDPLQVIPIIGVGEYVIGTEPPEGAYRADITYGGSPKLYRFERGSFEEIGDFQRLYQNNNEYFTEYAVDSLNPLRIAFIAPQASKREALKVNVYEAGEDGLDLVRTISPKNMGRNGLQ